VCVCVCVHACSVWYGRCCVEGAVNILARGVIMRGDEDNRQERVMQIQKCNCI
jgi:hypothetical protein